MPRRATSNRPAPSWASSAWQSAKPQVHQVLVVTKIDGDSACHIAYVNARLANANAKAAEIADAKSFRCGTEQPERIGNPAKFYGQE
ncbi:hypothetical protein [Microvirga massiliensis]|uniref:hypothetical protein n=1 Tax=Microvirga massiliensis TaxID=1033741 RepID=UPI00062BD2C2|nr:hypothetical protein [Microvirga massiliensis]